MKKTNQNKNDIEPREDELIDCELDDLNAEIEAKKEAPKDGLVSMTSGKIKLFHDQSNEAFAKIKTSNGNRIERINSKSFREWLGYIYYSQNGKVANSESIKSAINTLSGEARYDGKKYELHNRVAKYKDAIWYDLCDEQWRAIKITDKGYKIVKNPPILFRRYSHQLPQVDPTKRSHYKDIEKLKRYFNVINNDAWLLTKVWIIYALVPDSPHPIPVDYGGQGSGKSIKEKISRKLIDPSEIEVMEFPSNKNELIQALSHHWFLPLDNISFIHDSISDLLCKAVTGAGFTKRELYSDDDDIIYKFKRCISINGINIPVQKPDLLDRCLLIEFKKIPKNKRLTEKEIWKTFEKNRAKIFGSMLKILSRALSLKKNISVKYKPRMADFAEWGEAIAQAMGYGKNVFLKAYLGNIKSQHVEAIEAHLVGQTIKEMINNRNQWSGTPTQLLEELNVVAENLKINTNDKGWPKGPGTLTKHINEIKDNLAELKILAHYNRKPNQRTWTIKKKTVKKIKKTKK